MSYFPMPNPISTTPIPPTGQSVRRFGYSTTVGATFTAIDSVGAATPYTPTVATRIEILSDNAGDTAAGNGARQVLVTGLNAAWVLTTELLSTSGVTPVVSTTSFIRVTKIEVTQVGIYGGSNLGTLSVRPQGGGTTFIKCLPTHSQSFSSLFCVPAGYYGEITGANLSSDSGKVVDILVLARDNADVVTAPFAPLQVAQIFTGVSGVNHFPYDPPIPISHHTDVFIQARVASGSATVSVEYWGWIAPL